MPLSPITYKFLPQTEGQEEYVVELPTRANDDGDPLQVAFPNTVPQANAIAEIKASFPRDAADTQIDIMQGGSEYVSKRMSVDDHADWASQKDKFPKGTSPELGDLLVEAGKAVMSGLGALGVNVAKHFDPTSQVGYNNQAARSLFNIIEGAWQGTDRLGDIMNVVGTAATKFALPSKSQIGKEASLDAYKSMWAMMDNEQAKAAGKFLTQENGLRGIANIGAPTEQDIKDAYEIGGVLDLTAVLPVTGALGMLAKSAAKNSIIQMAKHVVPSAVAGYVARAATKGAAMTGTAIEKTASFAFNQISAITEAVAENAVSKSSQQSAKYMARGALMGSLGYSSLAEGGSLVGTLLAGKALKVGGEIAEAALVGLEKGSIQDGLTQLSKSGASETTRLVARKIARALPNDAKINMLKSYADSVINTGALMGGLKAMEAYALDEDPIHGFAEGMASGIGMAGVMHVLPTGAALWKEKELTQKARLNAMFQMDMASRPEKRKLSFTGNDGTVTDILVNDLAGRANLYRNPDVSSNNKELLLSISRAAEKGGDDVVFHDGSPEVTKKFDDLGLLGGRAFQINRQSDGRSLIVVNTAAEGFRTADVVQEFFHANASEAAARDTLDGIIKQTSAKGTEYAFNTISDFSQRYTDALKQLDTEVGANKAQEYQEIITAASKEGVSKDDAVSMMMPILDEYLAHYAGAKLAGSGIIDIGSPEAQSLIDKAWRWTQSNLLSSFDITKQGLSKDPVYGHFFDESGKRIINPEIEAVVNRVLDAASKGIKVIEPKDTFDGVRYFDVTDEKPFYSIEDISNGEFTTTRGQKKEILNQWFREARQIAETDGNATTLVVDEALKESGAFHGNITNVKDGTPIIFSQHLSDDAVIAMARVEIDGKRVATPQQEASWVFVNRAIKGGTVISLDAWHDIGRTSGSREKAYYGRGNRMVLPIALQMSSEGGLNLAYLDVSKTWTHAKKMSNHFPEVKAEFSKNGISSMSSFVPFLKKYIDNFSSETPQATVNIEGFGPVLRDVMYNALNVRNRSSKNKYGAIDVARFENEPSFNVDIFGEKNVAVKLKDKTVQMRRNSVTLGQLRMDRIVGVSDVTVNTLPVNIDFNPMQVANKVRANFAANTTRRETVGTTEMLTDLVSGKRIAVSETGKATLFDNGRKVIYPSFGEAERAANMNSVALAREYNHAADTYSPMYAKFAAKKKNEFTSRSKPAEGKEKEHAEAKAAYEKAERSLGKNNFSEDERKQLKAERDFQKARMLENADTYQTTGNTGASGSFSEDPFIKLILEEGGLLSPSKAQKQKNWSYISPFYDYFNSSNYKIKGKGWNYLKNPTHGKIFSETGKTPEDMLGQLFDGADREGLATQAGIKDSSDHEGLWAAIENISKNSKSGTSESIVNLSQQEHIGNAWNQLVSTETKNKKGHTVNLPSKKIVDLEIGERVQLKDYVAEFAGMTKEEGQDAGSFVLYKKQVNDYSPDEVISANDSYGKVNIIVADYPEVVAGKASRGATKKTNTETRTVDPDEFTRRHSVGGKPQPEPQLEPQPEPTPSQPEPQAAAQTRLPSENEQINEMINVVQAKRAAIMAEVDGLQGQQTFKSQQEIQERANQLSQDYAELTNELKYLESWRGLYADPIRNQRLPVDDALWRLHNVFYGPNTAMRERVGFSVMLRKEFKAITKEQSHTANAIMSDPTRTYDAQIDDAYNFLKKSLTEGKDVVAAEPPSQKVEVKQITQEQADAFVASIEDQAAEKVELKATEADLAKVRRENKLKASEEKKALKAKDLSEMTGDEAMSLGQADFKQRLAALPESKRAEVLLRIQRTAVPRMAQGLKARGIKHDLLTSENIAAMQGQSAEQLSEAGKIMADMALSRADDYLESRIARASEPMPESPSSQTPKQALSSVKQYSLDEYNPQSGISYSDWLIKRSEQRKIAKEEMRRMHIRSGNKVPEELMDVAPDYVSPPKVVPIAAEKLVKDNPVAAKPKTIVSKKKLSAEDFVAKQEAQRFLKEEDRASFAREVSSIKNRMRGESEQRKLDRARNEEIANLFKKAKEVAAKETSKQNREIVTGERVRDGIQLLDKEIKTDNIVVITPTLKFKVYLPTGPLVGITANYDQAFKLANRHAKSKTRSR